jgi:hypothetical protein
MPRDVVKTTITLTVYAPAEDADRLRDASLETVLAEADDGGWIAGTAVKGGIAAVPADKLRQELVDIGNDGTFFDAIDEYDGFEDDGAPSP